MKTTLIFIVAVSLAAALPRTNQGSTDAELVREAVMDYVEGVYEGEPSRIERSVHPELAKRGYFRSEEDGEYKEYKMTFEQLVELSKGWSKGKDLANAPKTVLVYEVLDKTASVKLTADWGIDYMQLAKLDGKWKIVNVLWQSHPPASGE